jgi:hypothetical protein
MLRHLEEIGVVLDAVVEVVRRSPSIGTTRVRVTAPSSQAATPVDLGEVATSSIFVRDRDAAGEGAPEAVGAGS